MTHEVRARSRDAVLVEDAAPIRVMGMPVLEPVPSRRVPYELTDPFILVHEGRFRPSEMALTVRCWWVTPPDASLRTLSSWSR